MKTRWLVAALLSLVLLISTAPPSTAHLQFQPSSPKETTLPAGVTGSSLVSVLAPGNPSSPPCTSQTFPGSTTVFHENFDSVTAPNLPAGWATSVSGTQAVWRTSAGTVHPAGASAASSPNLVYFNSWTTAAGSTARLYRSIGLDLHRYSYVWLCIHWYRDSEYSGSDDRVQVQVYTSGGFDWTDVGPPLTRYSTTPGWWNRYMSIAAVAARQSAVFLGFLGIGEHGNDVHLDDIQVVAAQGVYLPLMVR